MDSTPEPTVAPDVNHGGGAPAAGGGGPVSGKQAPQAQGMPGWMIIAIIIVVLYAVMHSRRSSDDPPDWVKRQIGVQDRQIEVTGKTDAYGQRR
jgi:hypothetical protein